MKIIPVFRCSDMKSSLDFYTRILDFQMKYTDYPPDFPVMDLINEDMELQLSTMMGNKPFGAVANVRVDDVDGLFDRLVKRGLDTSAKKNSRSIWPRLTRPGASGSFMWMTRMVTPCVLARSIHLIEDRHRVEA